MYKECNRCKQVNSVTSCDKCGHRTCKACCQRVIIKDELSVFHKGCVPKRYLPVS